MTATAQSDDLPGTQRVSTLGNLPRSIRNASCHVPVILLLLLLAFGLRLYRLGAESFWYDEIVSVDLAQSPLNSLIAQTARDIHPPGYYLLLNLWQRTAGPVMELGFSFEFLYAYPSALLGVILCALIYQFARSLLGTRVAVVALALAAVHPFQIEYSQEVRMYTLGASICLLYAGLAIRLLRTSTRPQEHRPRTLGLRQVMALALVTACGLYTFYYFGFLLVVANLAVLGWWLQSMRVRKSPGLHWLAANAGAILLWSPWLPIFFRQAIEPPVPPWREEWAGVASIAIALYNTLLTYMAGNLLRPDTLAAGLLVVLALLAIAYLSMRARIHTSPGEPAFAAALPLLAFGPPLLIIFLSATVTPLFHTRYLFVFQGPFLILLAAALVQIEAKNRIVAVACLLALVGLSLGGAAQFWHSPALRADDHRGAVAQIAKRWRPGHAVLVNAGWAYRAFSVYWPAVIAVPATPGASMQTLPPPLGARVRLQPDSLAASLSESPPKSSSETVHVPVYYTGSLEGSQSLGWNDPEADFFAVDTDSTLEALATLVRHTSAIHHYRIYDTVSDPAGELRAALQEIDPSASSQPVTGRDFLRLETYNTGSELPFAHALPAEPAHFASGWRIEIDAVSTPRAGSILYLPARIHSPTPDLSQLPDVLGISLRLLDSTLRTVAQTDVGVTVPTPNTSSVADDQTVVLALPLPVTVAPVAYSLELVLYDRETLQPYSPLDHARQTSAGGLDVARLELLPPLAPPLITQEIARFDYLGIVSATPAHIENRQWELDLIVVPHAGPYTDDYDLILAWTPVTGGSASSASGAEWRAPLGLPELPSAKWVTGNPIGRHHVFDIPEMLEEGSYDVKLGLVRASDDMRIPVRTGLGLVPQEWITIGRVDLAASQ